MRLKRLAGIAGVALLAGLLFSGCSSNAEDTAVPTGSGKGQTTAANAPTATTNVQLNH